MNKPIISAPKRLQRILLAIQQYACDVSYEPDRKQVIAVALSRAPDPEKKPRTICQKPRVSICQSEATVNATPIHDYPYQRVGSDLFEWEG